MSEIVGVHPYADKFPMLTDAELDELAESIATIGLINPIVVDTAGLILDGRNRLEACNRSGVETVTTVYEGGDVAEFVIGCNVTRRNMTTGARAMATALVLQADGRRKKNDKGEGYWARGSISGLNIDSNINHSWQDRLKECGVVLDFKPDLAPAVVAGDIALNDAFTTTPETVQVVTVLLGAPSLDFLRDDGRPVDEVEVEAVEIRKPVGASQEFRRPAQPLARFRFAEVAG